MFEWLRSIVGRERLSSADYEREKRRILESTPIPVFWLLGKTGSGKSSIIRFLTGAEDARVGGGFRPQTQLAQQFDFPSSDDPLLRFLDTRGLGEAHYDAAADIEQFAEMTHVVIVSSRVTDTDQEDVLQTLRALRDTRHRRPVLLALTCLHELYPGQQHPDRDPFSAGGDPAGVPNELRRCIEEQAARFEGLVDCVEPIDLTHAEDGYREPCFGGYRLRSRLLELLPGVYRQTFLEFDEAMKSLKDLNDRRAMPYILGYSSMAATAAAVPTPWFDIPVVMAIQSHLVLRLRSIYGQQIRADAVRQLAAVIGGRLVVRMMVRELLKLIPFAGAAANAALAYAYTYGLGKACCWYFGEICAGNAPSDNEVRDVWKEQLSQAARLWSERRSEAWQITSESSEPCTVPPVALNEDQGS